MKSTRKEKLKCNANGDHEDVYCPDDASEEGKSDIATGGLPIGYVEYQPPIPSSSSARSSDRSSRSKRTSSRNSSVGKSRGKAALNDMPQDSPTKSEHDESFRKPTLLDSSRSSRGSNTSGVSSQRSYPSATPSTSRSITPSTFYTPESSRRSSLTDTSEVSSGTHDDQIFVTHKTKQPSPIVESDSCTDSSNTLTEAGVPASIENDVTTATTCTTTTTTTTTTASTTPPATDNGDSEKGAKPKTTSSIFKLPAFLRKGNEEVPSLPQSTQSSVVGLDWLFSTDSDSASSGE